MSAPPTVLLPNRKPRFTLFMDDVPKGRPRTYYWVDHLTGAHPISGCTHPHECITRWEEERGSLYPDLFGTVAGEHARQTAAQMRLEGVA